MYAPTLFGIVTALTIGLGSCQQVNVSLPLRLKAGAIESSDSECPPLEDIELARSELSDEISEQLQSVERYFNSERYAYSCGGTDGWARFAYLNMSDSSHSCPGYLREVTYDGIRLCTRNSSAFDDWMVCTSATFPSNGTTYSQVCGRVIGYGFGRQYCLEVYSFYYPDNTIDDYYGDGVTLTHGSVGNREHIWTFFSSRAEDDGSSLVCPCNPAVSDLIVVPPWVGNDYFCEAGSVTWPGYVFLNEPLWDGDGCYVEGNECCSFNNPPYLSKQLSGSTSNDIELRACAYRLGNGNGYSYPSDINIQLVELYVK